MKYTHHLFGIIFIAAMAGLGAQESSPRPNSKAKVDGSAKPAPTHARVSDGDDPDPAGQPQLDSVHGAAHGVKLKETLDQLGVECHLAYPGKPLPQYRDHIGFLIRKLTPSKTSI